MENIEINSDACVRFSASSRPSHLHNIMVTDVIPNVKCLRSIYPYDFEKKRLNSRDDRCNTSGLCSITKIECP
jgi:hypothetical protein